MQSAAYSQLGRGGVQPSVRWGRSRNGPKTWNACYFSNHSHQFHWIGRILWPIILWLGCSNRKNPGGCTMLAQLDHAKNGYIVFIRILLLTKRDNYSWYDCSVLNSRGDSWLHVLAEFVSASWAHIEKVQRLTTSGECGDDHTWNKQHQHNGWTLGNRS